MKDRIVPSQWIFNSDGRRLDCGPYLSGAIEAKVLLDKISARKDRLIDVVKEGGDGIFHAGREGRTWVNDPKYGTPFLGSTDIMAADLSFLALISKKQVAETPKFVLHRGWTLITRSGTVGRTAYCRSNMEGLACSEDVMRVVADTEKIRPGYLYAFLASRFGVPLVAGGTYGSIIQHIEPEHIAALPIPRFSRDLEAKIHSLVEEASELLGIYQSEVQSATADLFAAVGLNDLEVADRNPETSSVGFAKRITSSASLRALNFNPRFEEICKKIKSVSWKPLQELCEPGTLRPGARFKRIDAEPEFAFRLVGQKEIFWLRPEGRWIAKKSVGGEVFAKPGTTLVAAQGTLGESELYCRSEFVWGPAVQNAYSQHFLRVVSNEELMLRGCMFSFMRSETAFRMLRSISMGTKLQDHHPILLRELPVPYPAAKIREHIHEKVRDAHEKRNKAVALEDEAIRLVEDAITEGANGGEDNCNRAAGS